jgi:hypothetical protein
MNERPGAVVDLGAKPNLKSFCPPKTLKVEGSKAKDPVAVVESSSSS